jgi:hypothetical protein
MRDKELNHNILVSHADTNDMMAARKHLDIRRRTEPRRRIPQHADRYRDLAWPTMYSVGPSGGRC